MALENEQAEGGEKWYLAGPCENVEEPKRSFLLDEFTVPHRHARQIYCKESASAHRGRCRIDEKRESKREDRIEAFVGKLHAVEDEYNNFSKQKSKESSDAHLHDEEENDGPDGRTRFG